MAATAAYARGAAVQQWAVRAALGNMHAQQSMLNSMTKLWPCRAAPVCATGVHLL
jgi:hypothetical protein